MDVFQQRLCPRAAITMKEPHSTHKQRLTHTHTHIARRIHTEMRAKQTTEGGDGDWCVLALGGLRSSNSDVAPFKEWPQRSGLHKDKEDKQSKSTQRCPSGFMTDSRKHTDRRRGAALGFRFSDYNA